MKRQNLLAAMPRRRGVVPKLLLFTLPAFVIYALFAIYPLFGSMVISLKPSVGTGEEFPSLANYLYLVQNAEQSARLTQALRNNIVYFLIHLVVQIPLGLGIAALLTSKSIRKSRAAYRTMIFIPTTLSVVIVGFIWRMIISPLWGIVTYPLLDSQGTVLPTLAFMSIWQHVGVPMIFLYTALIAIPNSLLEAAEIDGASAWTTFWKIKFPLIVPQFGLISILTFILTFNSFDIMYALKGAAPGPDYSADILATLFYRTYFGWLVSPGNPELGAAVATLVFALIAIVTVLYFVLIQRRFKSYRY